MFIKEETHKKQEQTDAQPERTFQVEPFTQNTQKSIARVLRAIWIVFLLVGFLSHFFSFSGLMMAMFLSIALILAGIDTLLCVLTDPTRDTIIELYQNKIVRKGNRLKYAEIDFENIGKLWEDEHGIWLSRKGLKTNLKLYLSDMNRVAEKDIIFIPRQIEYYTQLKKYLFSLITE